MGHTPEVHRHPYRSEQRPTVGAATSLPLSTFCGSQQASSNERLLDLGQGNRVQVHLSDGLLDQLTSDGEPLLPRR